MSTNNLTRARILKAARVLFTARSYADVGVAEICDAAGVRKSSFYHFFPSKRELSLAVLDATFGEMKTGILDRAFADEVPPMERLRRLVELAGALQADLHRKTGVVPGCPFGNLAAEQGTQDDVLRQGVDRVFQRLTAGLAGALTEAVDRGDIGTIDVPATADAMLAFMEGVMLLGKTRNDPAVIARLLPNMLDIRVAPEPNG